MTRLSVTTIALFSIASLALSTGATAQTKANPDHAMSLFASQKCVLCHSIASKGNPKGSLDEVGAKLKPEEIRQWLVDPDGMRTRTKATRTPPMKPLKLTNDQVDALVAYLQTLKGHASNASR